MPRPRPFRQVDVFGAAPGRGNPVAVVLDGTGLADEDLRRFAAWTNLSETTFVLPPTTPDADLRVRILTPTEELPFAGHPTLGTVHAWREERPERAARTTVTMECGAGLVPVCATPDGLAFAAPPLRRSGPVDAALLDHVAALLGIGREEIVDATWAANGPGWVAVLLRDAAAVLALRPGAVDLDLGVVGPHPPGAAEAFEVRAFFPVHGATVEDPVTGSLNAALADWLIDAGRAPTRYVARQGTALGRQGRVHVSRSDDGGTWIAGATATVVRGEAWL
ncbi:PhzF family phenazine biosynthesis protein [Patulibacter sp. SYSU D01012]|uniref:PhzF family phenazine biosynthesis protein n=1 Tax=Patulibacter sp. SYSU D01012 TaxID=2817381 RepID=UPI001B307A9C